MQALGVNVGKLTIGWDNPTGWDNRPQPDDRLVAPHGRPARSTPREGGCRSSVEATGARRRPGNLVGVATGSRRVLFQQLPQPDHEPQALVVLPLPDVAAEDQAERARFHGHASLVQDLLVATALAAAEQHRGPDRGADHRVDGVLLTDRLGIGPVHALGRLGVGEVDLHDVGAELGRGAGRVVHGVEGVLAALLVDRAAPRVEPDHEREPETVGVAADLGERLEVGLLLGRAHVQGVADRVGAQPDRVLDVGVERRARSVGRRQLGAPVQLQQQGNLAGVVPEELLRVADLDGQAVEAALDRQLDDVARVARDRVVEEVARAVLETLVVGQEHGGAVLQAVLVQDPVQPRLLAGAEAELTDGGAGDRAVGHEVPPGRRGMGPPPRQGARPTPSPGWLPGYRPDTHCPQVGGTPASIRTAPATRARPPAHHLAEELCPSLGPDLAIGLELTVLLEHLDDLLGRRPEFSVDWERLASEGAMPALADCVEPSLDLGDNPALGPKPDDRAGVGGSGRRVETAIRREPRAHEVHHPPTIPGLPCDHASVPLTVEATTTRVPLDADQPVVGKATLDDRDMVDWLGTAHVELDEVAGEGLFRACHPLQAAISALGRVEECACRGGLRDKALIATVLEAGPRELHAPEDAVLAELATVLVAVDGLLHVPDLRPGILQKRFSAHLTPPAALLPRVETVVFGCGRVVVILDERTPVLGHLWLELLQPFGHVFLALLSLGAHTGATRQRTSRNRCRALW